MVLLALITVTREVTSLRVLGKMANTRFKVVCNSAKVLLRDFVCAQTVVSPLMIGPTNTATPTSSHDAETLSSETTSAVDLCLAFWKR